MSLAKKGNFREPLYYDGKPFDSQYVHEFCVGLLYQLDRSRIPWTAAIITGTEEIKAFELGEQAGRNMRKQEEETGKRFPIGAYPVV